MSQVEGAGGGGLAPWATITGTGSSNQIGGSAYVTRMNTQGDYELRIAGAAVGVHDRVELGMARWSFRLADVVPGRSLEMNVASVKVRLAGDAVYDQDTWMPQISVGAQYKSAQDRDLVKALGASATSDIDVYATATKLWLGAAAGRNVIASGAVRLTRANQFGILGYGGDLNDRHRPQFEGSLAYLLNRRFAVGAEYRMKPDNLGIAGEDDAFDVFVAWFPNKHISLTAAYVDLGNIVIADDQRGLYLSLQAGF